MTVPWTPGLTLRCSGCGAEHAPGPLWFGCPACGAPLETSYGDPASPALPIAPEALTDLGRVATPLSAWRDEPTWLKLEQRNPTASHKDRFHAVTSAIARELGAAGVVTTSTGNHGVSCAAHAAADGLPCVVLSTGELPQALLAQITVTGALVAMLPAAERRRVLVELVEEGWVPATSSDSALSGAGNPYGADGYREIVNEIVATLGRMPKLIAVPAASGDTVVGIARGVLASTDEPPAVVLACQPAAAAAIEASLASGEQVTLAEANSVARSTSDPTSGRLAIEAVARCGRAVSVADDDIVETTLELARRGLYVETSSALALAGIRMARRLELVGPDDLCVAVITGGGRGWSENEPRIVDGLSAALSAEELLERTRTLTRAIV
jgi:threonine synthase